MRETNRFGGNIFIAEQIDDIISDYINGVPLKEISIKYNMKSIHRLINKYNLPKRNKKWTKPKIDYLLNNYENETWEALLFNLSGFTQQEINNKACRLKLRRENYFFSDYEINILKSYYSSMPIMEIIDKYMPNRTESSICTKANKMGLVSRERWTEEENELLIRHYPTMNNKHLANKHFPNRSESSLSCQASVLGLSKLITNQQYTKDDLIDYLKELAGILNRTPTCEDIANTPNFPSPSTYHRFFESYGNACKLAGLELNHNNIFGSSGYYIASDGTECLSNAELIVTEYLIKNNIAFKKEVFYKDIVDDDRVGNKRCDWLLSDGAVVEYFGMPEKDCYKAKMDLKINICKDNNIRLIQIFRKDLKKLNLVLKPLTR